MKLIYQDKVADFPVIENLAQIKKEFNIPESKKVFKIAQSGSLLELKENNLIAETLDMDKIEAISDFELG